MLPAEELVPIAAAAPEPFSFTPSPQPAEAVIAAPEIVATEPGNHATQGPANREELASTELMDRLAEALRRRRQARAASVEVAPALAAAVPAELHSLPRLLPLAAQPAASSAVEPTPIIVPAIMLPLALSPIDFGSLDDDAAVEQPPMRHLAMPGNASAPINGNAVDGLAASLALSQESAQGLPSLSPDDDPEPTDSDDEAYSSLLEMDVLPSPPRQDFIRIEENEATSEAIEPVVIFPGHSVGERSAMAAVAFHDRARADTYTPSSEVASTAYARDPEETERALRAALTSLQLMSGAA